MLAASLVYVFSLNVHDHSSRVAQPVGAPSFIAGDCAARIGSKMNGVSPRANAPNTASTRRGCRNFRQRWLATVTTTASPGSQPAGCTAYPAPRRQAIAKSASEIVYTFSFTTD